MGETAKKMTGRIAGDLRRTFSPGSSRLSEDQIAIKALQAYNGEAQGPNVYNRLKGYAGGTLYLIEFSYSDGSNEHWSVLVRGDETQVFYDHEMALRESVMWARSTTFLTLGGLVTAVISVAIVVVFLWFAVKGDNSKEPQSLAYALSSVLGFWFGKSVTSSKPDRSIGGE